MGGVDSWSREGQARFKRLQGQEGREKRLKGSNTGIPGKKTLLARYNARGADLLAAIERRETLGRASWWCGGLEWYEKRFDKARQNRLKAGIAGV